MIIARSAIEIASSTPLPPPLPLTPFESFIGLSKLSGPVVCVCVCVCVGGRNAILRFTSMIKDLSLSLDAGKRNWGIVFESVRLHVRALTVVNCEILRWENRSEQ